MAVYERTYRPYTGTVTPERTRFLVLPRYAYQEVFRSKLFTAFLLLSWVWPLVLALIIYLPHNISFLKRLSLDPESILDIFDYGPSFFLGWFMVPYAFVAFAVAFVVGPTLISADLRNNGLPLYLSRPFGRWEYILGKTAVLIILLSVVTWIPGLLLFLLQAYLGGTEWLSHNWSIGPSIFFASWIWILMLCLLSLAVSAYVKWKPVAQATLLLIWFPLALMGELFNELLRTRWGSMLNLLRMIGVVYADLFGVERVDQVPVWAAWASLLAAGAVCVALLSRKVRAYEVVRS